LEAVIEWSWFLVMSPLFVLQALLICFPIILTILTLCCDRLSDQYWFEDTTRWADDTGGLCLGSTIFIVLVLAPLLAFQILLGQVLDHSQKHSFAIVFTPIFLFQGFLLCNCCIVNVAFGFSE